MAQTGFTPLSLYYSATATNVPLAANLVAGELALNTADGKLFYKDSSGVVQVLGTKGGVGSSSNTQVLFNSSGLVAGSASLTWNGTTLSASSITNSGLTATRLVYSGTAGLETDSANLTFNGTILTSTGFAGPLNGTVGATTANTGAFTTLTTSSTVTLNGGTANGVAYLDGSKVLTTGSALTFDGTTFAVAGKVTATPAGITQPVIIGQHSDAAVYGVISFSGSTSVAGTTGLAGGGSGDNNLYVKAPTGYAVNTAINNSTVTTITSSGLEVKQAQLIGYSSYAGIGTNGLAVAGNVGIGTASPAALLHLSSGNGTKAIWGTTRSFTVNRNWQVAVDEYAEGQFTITPSTTLGGTTFTTPAIRIDSAGNVGIGASSPGVKLDVSYSDVAYNPGIRVKNTSNNSASQAKVYVVNDADQYFSLGRNSTVLGSASVLFSTGAYPIDFYTNSTFRATIDSAGNLGLGVTPSAWSAGNKVLQFGTRGLLNCDSNGVAYYGNNFYFDGTDFKYIQTAAAAILTQDAGAFKFYNAPSGTAGNAITFTQAMTLDASGNLLLGGTSNVFGYKQEITGTSASSPFAGLALYNTSASQGAKIAFLDNSNSAAVGNLDGNLVFYAAGRDNERARIDSSGNLLMGATSSIDGNLKLQLNTPASTSRFIGINRDGGYGLLIGYDLAGVDYANIRTVGAYALTFGTSNTERARIDASGNLLVGQTSAGRQDINGISLEPKVSGGGYAVFNHATGSSSGRQFLTFAYAGTEIGSITQSGTTATLFNVTSDQRLKENIQDAAPASALIDSLQVREYDWKSDGSHQRYGFVAQELVTVAPEAVHQPVNSEEMMAVDYSKLVPMLVKEIQDLRKRLAALESK